MTKTLCKAIMRNSELETEYFTQKRNDTLKDYKKRKINAANFTKKEEKISLKICIFHLLLAIKTLTIV